MSLRIPHRLPWGNHLVCSGQIAQIVRLVRTGIAWPNGLSDGAIATNAMPLPYGLDNLEAWDWHGNLMSIPDQPPPPAGYAAKRVLFRIYREEYAALRHRHIPDI
jgi:hypothetical protein